MLSVHLADTESEHVRGTSNLCVVVVGPFIVGQLQLAKRDFLPHPVSARVRRFRMNIHFVTYKIKSRD